MLNQRKSHLKEKTEGKIGYAQLIEGLFFIFQMEMFYVFFQVNGEYTWYLTYV